MALTLSGISVSGRINMGAPVVVDPDFSNVQLLAHFDGTNDSTTFVDSSGTPKTLTANGNAKLSTTLPKFGTASGYFDGSGDYVEVGTPAAFAMPGDFTIESWIKTTSTTEMVIFRTSSIMIFIRDGGLVWWDMFSGFTTLLSTVNTGNWESIAFSRVGTALRMFHNGVVVNTITRNQNFTSNASVRIGMTGNFSPYLGYLDELRVTVGVGRYTANYTPATSAFPNA